jgi:hypothetical protein
MPAPARAVPITEAVMKAARRRHRDRLATEPKAVSVRYDGRRNTIVIQMSNGAALVIPRGLLQGLGEATTAQLREAEIGNDGLELYWPELDAAFTLMSLLAGVYGSRRWMSDVARRAGSVKSPAKAAAARTNGRKGGRPRKTSAA